MPKAQQTFVNDQTAAIYVSIEPWADCYELKPGEKLTLVYDLPETGDALSVHMPNGRELVVWPDSTTDPEVLIDGEPGAQRNWAFNTPTSQSPNSGLAPAADPGRGGDGQGARAKGLSDALPFVVLGLLTLSIVVWRALSAL